jgi:coenzyme Q-binding protein COQ10
VTHFAVTRRMAHSPQALYAIAADVQRYSSFVPLCTDSSESSRLSDEQGRERFRGTLRIAYPKLSLAETLQSDVALDPQRLMVRATANEGPVKHLESRWAFRPDGKGGTEVEFSVDFTMSSRILHGIVTGLFDYAMRKIMNAFEERAETLYGRHGCP